LVSAAVTTQDLKEGDLVILTLHRLTANAHCPSDAVNSLPAERRVFGFIKQTHRYGSRNSEQLHPLISELDSCQLNYLIVFISLQCFDAVGWAAGRASGL